VPQEPYVTLARCVICERFEVSIVIEMAGSEISGVELEVEVLGNIVYGPAVNFPSDIMRY
jgi:hypothetical protein